MNELSELWEGRIKEVSSLKFLSQGLKFTTKKFKICSLRSEQKEVSKLEKIKKEKCLSKVFQNYQSIVMMKSKDRLLMEPQTEQLEQLK